MEENKPLAHNGEIILYQPDNSIRLEVRMEEDTVWLTQAQTAVLLNFAHLLLLLYIKIVLLPCQI